jgi:polysaccharide export outer membrane protein
LSAGDAVQITVWRHPDLSGEFPIADDGTIIHPLYHTIHVANVPLSTVRERIHDFLATLETDPQFVVQPLLHVAVGGEVKQPTIYKLPPETSIAEAVALAGGATDRGKLDEVRLFRDGDHLTVDLTQPEHGLAQTPIHSGDQIYVDRKTSFFREYIAPAGSITAALVSMANLLIRH